jgi:hypothetical protein
MAKPTYRLTALFANDPLGLRYGDYSGKGEIKGAVPALHKWNSKDRPYSVANDYICSTIGQFLGLPIPPFAITQPPNAQPSKYVFSSLSFNFGNRDPSPVEADPCVASQPELCAGIVAFDVLIANNDRHDENLAVDRLDSPREIHVFDQDCGLFGINSGKAAFGTARLDALVQRLGITGSDFTDGNRHILLDAIKDTKFFEPWLAKAWQLGIPYLQRICDYVVRLELINEEEAKAAVSFLEYRGRGLAGILNRHRSEFSGVSAWRSR